MSGFDHFGKKTLIKYTTSILFCMIVVHKFKNTKGRHPETFLLFLAVQNSSIGDFVTQSLTKGRAALPKRMNFWKSSKRPLIPPPGAIPKVWKHW